MDLRIRPTDEWRRLVRAVGRLDAQTVFVLLTATAMVVVQFSLGSRSLFRRELAQFFPPEIQGLLSWGWWFGVQAITGFVLPVLALLVIFRRRPAEIGLGVGDWRFGSFVAAIYLPIVVVGAWLLSDNPSFQAQYPHFQPAARSWQVFAVYEFLFLLYWIGWEYLWRGFILFGTAHTFGIYAIVVQAVPFTILHLAKPFPETILSLAGGLALGMLVWRCRSFWIAVPIHAAQMIVLDFWCTMRVRSGVNGIGLESLTRLLAG